MFKVSIFALLSEIATNFASTIQSKLSSQQRIQQTAVSAILIMAILCVLTPLDTKEIMFALAGAATYYGVRATSISGVVSVF
mmetsp:Transcript_133802/g.257501  ORF Transcript_133802/g.257501 Transcript_133802/m.257501 type:complete len:82 (+) Transcript_133802:243-488(+)